MMNASTKQKNSSVKKSKKKDKNKQGGGYMKGNNFQEGYD